MKSPNGRPVKIDWKQRDNLIDEIDNMIYGIEPLFSNSKRLNRFAALVWDTIKARLGYCPYTVKLKKVKGGRLTKERKWK